MRKERAEGKSLEKGEPQEMSRVKSLKKHNNDEDDGEQWEELTYDQLAESMKEEHGLTLKKGLFQKIRAEESILVTEHSLPLFFISKYV